MNNPHEVAHVEAVASYFDAQAAAYDETAAQQGWPGNELLRQVLADPASLELTRLVPRSALVVGAGTGSNELNEILRIFPKLRRVVAVDASAEMFGRLQENYQGPRVEVVHSDIDSYLQKTRRKFDLVTAMDAVQFLPRPDLFFFRVAEHLNPGGRFVGTYEPVVEWSPTQSAAEEDTGNGFPIRRHTLQNIARHIAIRNLFPLHHTLFRRAPQQPDEHDIVGFIVAF